MQSVGDLDRLARSFERHLRAENKSPKTVATYGEAVSQPTAHLAGQGVESVAAILREHVEEFMTHLLEKWSSATASNKFRALQQFFRWLVDDEHVSVDPMAKMRAPSEDGVRTRL
jgi:integrase/recombinase XerC